MIDKQTPQYQGHLSSRSDGREKRILLLEATLKIIIRDGIRGVRHRAVAAEAEVSLSSTTYYFKDILVLINDAFLYFSQQELTEIKQLQTDTFAAISHILKFGDDDKAKFDASEKFQGENISMLINENQKLEIAELITKFILNHIQKQAADIERRYLEYAFQNEALHNPLLADALHSTQDVFIHMLQVFFQALASDEAEAKAKAHIALATIRHIEYQLISSADLSINNRLVIKTINQLTEQLLS